MARQFKILLLFDAPYPTPPGYDFKVEFRDREDWDTEADVFLALRAGGHTVKCLGLYDDIRPLLDEARTFAPDVIFNLAEVFDQRSPLEKNVAAVLEMLKVPFTGASAQDLFLCNDKALAKMVLGFHGIPVPRFQVFDPGEESSLPLSFGLPAIVKPLSEEASRGIAFDSVVRSGKALARKVRAIHDRFRMAAIVEEYIEGRELYVSILGDKKIKIFPIRELKFGKLLRGPGRVATYRVKWDARYRRAQGIRGVFASGLSIRAAETVRKVCLKAYRALGIKSYARFDVRLTPQGDVYVLEPNANPCLARLDDFARSAQKAGIAYPQLIQQLVDQALGR